MADFDDRGARSGGGEPPPPAGGFGAPPPPGFLPPLYGPPPVIRSAPPQTQGNMVLGFLAGFVGGCIGYVLVLVLAKGPDTKKGAGLGFACQIVLGAVLRLVRVHP
jgi:hypothetical protein